MDEQRMSIGSIYLDLCKEGEGDPVVELTYGFDRFIGFWFLSGKLIARES